tara:strand:+ start:344 stop:892 length:549 start_codon:yes stop_codon:yes gene_type:complete
MSWGSSIFENAVGYWLESNQAPNDDATAKEIASAYARAARTVSPRQFTSKPIGLKSEQLIFGGFSASFKLARVLTIGKPNAAVWLPAASSIVAYWTAVTFSPMPPPPGGLTGITNITTVPGLPTPLNFQIGSAFQEEDPHKVAESLNSAMENHLMTVTGLWSGTAPAAPSPVPYAFPWVGLK